MYLYGGGGRGSGSMNVEKSLLISGMARWKRGAFEFTASVLVILCILSLADCQIPDAVCPGTGAVNVQQPEWALREADAEANLTCQFRVPPGQLAQVTWIRTEGNSVILRYSPPNMFENSDPQLVQGYAANYSDTDDDTAGTGSCNITLLAEVSNTDIYKCEVFLKNHTYCTDQKGIDFVEPARTMSCNDTVICSSENETCEGAKYDGCCIFGGFIDFCRPESVLSLWYNDENENWVEISTSEEIGTNQYDYCEATLTSLGCMEYSENRRIMFHVTEGQRTYTMWITYPPDPTTTIETTAGTTPTAEYPEDDDPTTSSSLAWIWILAIVLVILCCFLIAFVVWRKKKKKIKKANGPRTFGSHNEVRPSITDPESHLIDRPGPEGAVTIGVNETGYVNSAALNDMPQKDQKSGFNNRPSLTEVENTSPQGNPPFLPMETIKPGPLPPIQASPQSKPKKMKKRKTKSHDKDAQNETETNADVRYQLNGGGGNTYDVIHNDQQM